MMNNQCQTASSNRVDLETHLIPRVLTLSALLLIIFTAGGWYFSGWSFVRSLLIGGLLVNGSFCLLKSDIQRLMQRMENGDGSLSSTFNGEKFRFFLKFYARLVTLGLLLFVLASQFEINVVGLTLGLTTVMVSVVIIGLSKGKCLMPSKV